MVGDLARDRLRALRLALGEVVLAHDLPRGLDRLRPAAGEEHAVEVAGRALGQRLGEPDRWRVRRAPVRVEGERGELLARDRRHLFAERVAELAADQRAQPVEVALPVGVENVLAPLPALQHQQPVPARPEGAVAGEVHQQVAVRKLLKLVGGQGFDRGHAVHACPLHRTRQWPERRVWGAASPTNVKGEQVHLTGGLACRPARRRAAAPCDDSSPLPPSLCSCRSPLPMRRRCPRIPTRRRCSSTPIRASETGLRYACSATGSRSATEARRSPPAPAARRSAPHRARCMSSAYFLRSNLGDERRHRSGSVDVGLAPKTTTIGGPGDDVLLGARRFRQRLGRTWAGRDPRSRIVRPALGPAPAPT